MDGYTYSFNGRSYRDVESLWTESIEELTQNASIGMDQFGQKVLRIHYSIFLNPEVINMWLEDFGAYDPDTQAADFLGAVETAIQPAFEIPRELNRRFRQWVRTLTVEDTPRPFTSLLHGDYKVL